MAPERRGAGAQGRHFASFVLLHMLLHRSFGWRSMRAPGTPRRWCARGLSRRGLERAFLCTLNEP